MRYTRLIVNILEPKQQYLLDFVDVSLKGCQKQLQDYLRNSPPGTDYMHLQCVYTKDRKTKYAPMMHPTSNVVVNIGDINENR